MNKFWAGVMLVVSVWLALIVSSCSSVTVFYDKNGRCLKVRDQYGVYHDCKNDWARDRR